MWRRVKAWIDSRWPRFPYGHRLNLCGPEVVATFITNIIRNKEGGVGWACHASKSTAELAERQAILHMLVEASMKTAAESGVTISCRCGQVLNPR